MEKIIHYCWFGGKKKPASVKKCIKTWKKKLPDFKLMEWNEDNFDVNSTEFSKQAFAEKKWAFVSDVARIYAIYEYGGIYLDTDVEVLDKIDFVFDNDFWMGKESEDYVGTAVIGVKEKHNKHIKKILDIYKNTKFDSSDIYAVTGPKLFTDYFIELGLKKGDGNEVISDGEINIYDRAYFYPKSYDGQHDKYNKNTCMVHNFKASWTSRGEKVCNFLIKHHLRFMIKPIFKVHDFIKVHFRKGA